MGQGTQERHLNSWLCRWSLKDPSGHGSVRPARQALPTLARGACSACQLSTVTSPVRGPPLRGSIGKAWFLWLCLS